VYSLIGFFVILSLWGIVAILSNSFGLQNTTSNAPTSSSLKNLMPGESGSGLGNPIGG